MAASSNHHQPKGLPVRKADQPKALNAPSDRSSQGIEGQTENDEDALLTAGQLGILVDLGGSAVGGTAGIHLLSGQDGTLLVTNSLGILGHSECGNEVSNQQHARTAGLQMYL